jgi:hypothetical protein
LIVVSIGRDQIDVVRRAEPRKRPGDFSVVFCFAKERPGSLKTSIATFAVRKAAMTGYRFSGG